MISRAGMTSFGGLSIFDLGEVCGLRRYLGDEFEA